MKRPEHRIGLPVTPELKVEAEQVLRTCDDWLRPASREHKAKWIVVLGTVTANRPEPTDDAGRRVEAYIGLLDASAACFSKETLQNAAKRFRWFPSVAELAEFFDEYSREVRQIRFMAQRVANAPVNQRSARAKGRATDPTFVLAMGDWSRIRAENAERERHAAANRPRTPTRPILVSNPALDALVDQARALAWSTGEKRSGSDD
jgi:hypothetical protein